MRIREQVGPDVPERFDYQLALAIEFLVTSDEPIIILIETLEDFAVIKNFNRKQPQIDVFQVKTIGSGLMDKSRLIQEDVYGKMYLTDYYFENKANSLNIISNSNLKGANTEKVDKFCVFEKFSKEEISKVDNNIINYFNKNEENINLNEIDKSKLVYVKTQLPLKEKMFEKTLVGTVSEFLKIKYSDTLSYINPEIIFKTLKDAFVVKRGCILPKEISLEDAIKLKGISSQVLEEILEQAKKYHKLQKSEIITCASNIFNASFVNKIRNTYPQYLSYTSDLGDKQFIQFNKIVEENIDKYLDENGNDQLSVAIKNFCENCNSEIYDKSLLAIIAINHIYGN